MGNLVDERVAILSSRCRKGSQSRPGIGPLFGFIATGNRATDDSRTQLSFGSIIGGLHLWLIEKGEQMIPLFGQPSPQLFFVVSLGIVGVNGSRTGYLHFRHLIVDVGFLIPVLRR